VEPPLAAVATSAAACIIDTLLSVAPFTKSGYVFAAAGTPDCPASTMDSKLNATPGVVQGPACVRSAGPDWADPVCHSGSCSYRTSRGNLRRSSERSRYFRSPSN